MNTGNLNRNSLHSKEQQLNEKKNEIIFSKKIYSCVLVEINDDL